MPTNLAENALSALKVGNENVTAAYVGNSQIFPNTVELTSWGGIPLASYGNGSYTVPVTVTGQVGATFALNGSNGISGSNSNTITQTGGQNFNTTISHNVTCGAASRTPSLTIAATGSTTLASGFGSTTDTATQAAGPTTTSTTIAVPTPGIADAPGFNNQANYTTVVSGTNRWANGATFTMTWAYTTLTSTYAASSYPIAELRGVGDTMVSGSNYTINSMTSSIGAPTDPNDSQGPTFDLSGFTAAQLSGATFEVEFVVAVPANLTPTYLPSGVSSVWYTSLNGQAAPGCNTLTYTPYAENLWNPRSKATFYTA